jgi:glycerol uptake facilitator-like aquaporin
MDSEFDNGHLKHVFFYEMVGTCALAMTINLASSMGVLHIPAICFCLLSQINILGGKSGCHVNPAVTLG